MEDERVMEVRALLKAPAVRTRTLDPDAALVAAARKDPQAFLALYDRYFDRVLGYVRLRIRDASTCEDIASTVFTKALGQRDRSRRAAGSRGHRQLADAFRRGEQASAQTDKIEAARAAVRESSRRVQAAAEAVDGAERELGVRAAPLA